MQPIRRVLSSGATGRVSKTKILPSSSGPPIDSESSGVIRPLINYSSKFYDTKGPAIEEIDLTELKPSLGEISSRTGFEELCAFSKINAPNPSIYVPGEYRRLEVITTRKCPNVLLRSSPSTEISQSTGISYQKSSNST